MFGYAYTSEGKNILNLLSVQDDYKRRLGTLKFNDSNEETDKTISFTPKFGNVVLEYDKNEFMSSLNNSLPFNTIISHPFNYRIIKSYVITVLARGLFTIPCPYVDHRTIFPSMQELIDTLKNKQNIEYFAVIPMYDDQYTVYIFEKTN